MASLFAELSAEAGSDSASSTAPASETLTPREQLSKEIENYDTIKVEKDANILLWWKVHEAQFPLLAPELPGCPSHFHRERAGDQFCGHCY